MSPGMQWFLALALLVGIIASAQQPTPTPKPGPVQATEAAQWRAAAELAEVDLHNKSRQLAQCVAQTNTLRAEIERLTKELEAKAKAK